MTPRRILTAVLVGALCSASVLIGAPSAGAAPSTVGQAQCGNTAAAPRISASRTTVGVNETAVVTVTGSDYLLPPHVCGNEVFGGIYLFFGWVRPGGQWGPSWRTSTSANGLFGESYSYPGEGGGGETRDDGTGTVRLVSFTPGGESGTATPFHMDGAGNWQSNLTIRGATYQFKDLRTGVSQRVDCRVVQCGVFTIGGHGKNSRTNEQFTPINFTDERGTPIAPSNPAAGGAGGSVGTVPPGAGGDAPVTGAQGGPTDGGDGGSTSTTAVPSGPGSVGEAPPTTDGSAAATADPDPDAAADADDGVLDSEAAASVQEFGSDDEGGGGATLPIALAAVVLVGGGAAGVVLRRRATRTTTEVAR